MAAITFIIGVSNLFSAAYCLQEEEYVWASVTGLCGVACLVSAIAG